MEAQLEPPLILTSIVIPASDVKKTNRDSSIVKLIWASNLLTRLIIGAALQKSLRLRITHIAWPGSHLLVAREAGSRSDHAHPRIWLRSAALDQSPSWARFLGFVIPPIPESLRSFFGARLSALWGCRLDTTWWKSCK